MLATEVPDEFFGRGIEPGLQAREFAISLDSAEPWGGGRIEGRVESRAGRRDRRPVTVVASCAAAWLDQAPQLLGQKPLWRPSTYWDLRTRGVPIWLDEKVWLERWEVGELAEANWLHFRFDLPPELPRAFEGTFVAFRWRVEARRRRPIGHDTTSMPLLLIEPRTLPTLRVETTPIGSWRLLEWRAETERDGSGGPCSVSYEDRRSEDMPLPGETREQEIARRTRS